MCGRPRFDQAIQAHGRFAAAEFIAGGTNLVDYLKEGAIRPTTVVDITPLPLTSIAERAGGLRLGALATNSAVAYHGGVRERYPVLSQALLAGASPQLRNVRDGRWQSHAADTVRLFPRQPPAPVTSANQEAVVRRSTDSTGAMRFSAVGPIASRRTPPTCASRSSPSRRSCRRKGRTGRVAFRCAIFTGCRASTPQLETTLEPGELITAVDLPALAVRASIGLRESAGSCFV